MAMKLVTSLLVTGALAVHPAARKKVFLQLKFSDQQENEVSESDMAWDSMAKLAGLGAAPKDEQKKGAVGKAGEKKGENYFDSQDDPTAAKTKASTVAARKAVTTVMAQARAAASPEERVKRVETKIMAKKNVEKQLKTQGSVIDALHMKLAKTEAAQVVQAINISALKRELTSTQSELASQTRLLNEASTKSWLVEKDYKTKLLKEQSKSVEAQAALRKAQAALQNEATVMAHLADEDSRASRTASGLQAELTQATRRDAAAEQEVAREKARIADLQARNEQEQNTTNWDEGQLRAELEKQKKMYAELEFTLEKANSTLNTIEASDGKEIKLEHSEILALKQALSKEQSDYTALKHNDTRDAASISAYIASNVSTMQTQFRKQLEENAEALKQLRAKGVKAIKALQGRLADRTRAANKAEQAEQDLRDELAEQVKATTEQNQSHVVLEQGLRDQIEAQKASAAASTDQTSEALATRTQERDDYRSQLQKENKEENQLRQELAQAKKGFDDLKANVTRDSGHIFSHVSSWLR